MYLGRKRRPSIWYHSCSPTPERPGTQRCCLCNIQRLVDWKNEDFVAWLFVFTKVVSKNSLLFSSVQSLSHVQHIATPWITARQASLSITNSLSSPKLMHQVGDAIQPSHALSSPSPPASNPSHHQSLFQWVNSSQEWPKYWSFSLSISPSNEHPGLVSFRMDWLDLLVVQGTLKNLLQHHSSKASILWHSAFFIVQLSHPYMTTGKTIALPKWTFVGKVMSLLFNRLSRLIITFLSRRKHLLISWLQSPSAVILEPKKIKLATVSPSICHEVMGPDAMNLIFWMLA